MWCLSFLPYFLFAQAAPPVILRDAGKDKTVIADRFNEHCGRVLVHNTNPLLVEMRDFTSKEESLMLLRLCRAQNLATSTVNNIQTTDKHIRSSETAWLHDNADNSGLLGELSARLSLITDLPTCHFEKWQAALYSPGGRFDEHTDHLASFNEFECGGRLSTLLLYLTDSASDAQDDGSYHEGGATEFTAMGVTITPKRGTAIFFDNVVVQDGEVLTEERAHDLIAQQDTAHAGREVEAGQKVILSKWVHPLPFPNGRSLEASSI